MVCDNLGSNRLGIFSLFQITKMQKINEKDAGSGLPKFKKMITQKRSVNNNLFLLSY